MYYVIIIAGGRGQKPEVGRKLLLEYSITTYTIRYKY